ncbi:MAG: hypothetical protein K6A38_00575 [Lachnospiraceae bacterium]|nr:hypothetical protein [Lachnospiraceae bacterium]
MKKVFKKLFAIVLSSVTVALIPLSAFAGDAAYEETSYTYNLDYWGDVQDSPDFYTVCKVFTSTELGLDVKLKSPEGLFVSGDLLYLCDTGNNRIIEIKRVSSEKLEVQRIIDSFKGADNNTFNQPTDIAISEDGNFFIADKGNARVLKLDKDFNFLLEFVKPVDNTLDPTLVFQPSKLSVDTAERVYCIATGINKGLIKYEPDGTFSGFVGATKVTFDFMDYLWKKFATQVQRAQMESFVPTEYDNLYMDHEGFVYACTGAVTREDLRADKADAVRKINLMGNDIMVRNGEWPIYGDIHMGSGGGYEGPSYFSDVTVFPNDIFVCLDRNRGRCFGYDDQGHMVFAFGGNGNMDGYFRRPVAIEHFDHDLLVLDTLDCAITVFVPTHFGSLVYKAIEEFDQGHYVVSGEAWEEVMKLNGNYDLAYIGIGRSLLRQERYKEALRYFEVKYDDENYSKAYKQYRKEWVEDHIVIIVVVLLALFLVPMAIGKYKSIKHEMEISDIDWEKA